MSGFLTIRRWRASLALALILSALALPLASCGKKALPEAPADQPNTYPRAYPRE